MINSRLPWCWPALLLLALACESNDDDDDDTAPTTTNDDDDSSPLPDDDDTTGTTDDDDCHQTETTCPDLINPVGDLSCLGQNPDPEPGEGTVIVSGVVRDFQSEVPVPGAFLEVHGTQLTATSAPDGSFSLEVPARQRINIRMSAAGYLPSWNYHLLTPLDDFSFDLVMVAEATFRLVPCIATSCSCGFGSLTNCVVAGAVSDCSGHPLEGFGITLTTEECSSQDTMVCWFKNEFPNNTQCPASADGLYGLKNITPPFFRLSVVGSNGETLAESPTLPCEPGSIGLLSLQIH